MTALYAQLRLNVNPAKSAVAPAWQRSFPGYSFWVAPGKIVTCRAVQKALTRMSELRTLPLTGDR